MQKGTDVLKILRWVWLMPLAMWGHELDLAVRMAAPAVVVRATYAGADAVPFAKVQVFGPGGGAEYQTGVTDKRGHFSFVPEGAGSWRVVVDDEEGHRREVAVAVPEKFEGAGGVVGDGRVSRWERGLTGVALILGATGFLYGFKARRGG